MTEGHPCFVANNGRLGFGIHEYLSYAPETASPVRLVWLAAHRSRAAFTAGVGHRVRVLPARRVGRGDRRALRRRPARPGPRPRRLPAHPGPPLAVVEQAHRHLRRRGRPQAPGVPRRGRRRVPGPAVHPDVLQHAPPREALREDGPVRPQHGLHARSVGRVHGGHPGDQRLARPAHRGRPGAAGRRACRSSGSGPRSATGTWSTRQATDRYSPYRKMLAALWRESPVPVPPGRRVAGHDGLAASMSTTRARPSRAP